MSHWITSQPDFGIDYQARTTLINLIYLQLVAKWWVARGHKGNSRVGTQWDYSHSCFVFLFHKLYKFYLFGGVLLLGRQPLVHKRLFTGKLQDQYKFIFRQISNCFSFICFVLQRTSNVHFWYMHLTLIAAHKFYMRNKKTITCNIRNRGKREISKPYSCFVHQV